MSDQPVFEIKKGIPVPPKRQPNGNAPVYPFSKMEVGDCFDVPRKGTKYEKNDATQGVVSSASRQFCRNHAPDRKFTVRIIDDSTVRVWRIK